MTLLNNLSALKENEVWLDSISGKISQFNNAVQALWSNTLDSDIIKFFVELATQLVKLVDEVGLFGTALAGAFVYFTAFKQQTPLALLQQIWGVISGIGASIKANGIGRWLTSLMGITPALKAIIAETIANTIATQTNDAAKTKQLMTEMGLIGTTGTLSAKQREAAMTATLQAMSTGQLTMTQGNAILAMLGYSAATTAADGSLKTLDATTKAFMLTNPIGWILAIVSVLMTVVTLLSQIPTGIEKLTEEISNLKSEISDLNSEIDSLNSELETTQDRMAELLAMPSLSFVEQEELNNLKQTTAELERQIKLKEMLVQSQTENNNQKLREYIDKVWHSNGVDKSYMIVDGVIKEDKWWQSGVDTKVGLDQAISKYKEKKNAKEEAQRVYEELVANDIATDDKLTYELFNRIYQAETGKSADKNDFSSGYYGWSDDSSLKSWTDYLRSSIQRYDSELSDIAGGINMVFADENFDGLKYGMSTEINAFLDELYAYQYKWEEAQGISSKSNAIASMFDGTGTEKMQELGKELQAIMDDDSISDKNQEILNKLGNLDGTDDAVLEVDKLSDAYGRLKTTMEIVGVTAQDIADYFVLESGAFDSSTVEGITSQYQTGINVLQKYKEDANAILGTWKNNATGEIENITWNSLFKDGEVIETQISKLLQDADKTARDEFARLIKTVNENNISLDDAIKSFGISGTLAGFKLVEESIKELNTDVFKNLGDDISGLIDTFEELGSVLDSVSSSMDLLSQAEAERAYSGSVSLETALKLMQSTDDWNKILTITEGSIKVNENATENLVKDQLKLVVANLKTSLSTVSAQIAQNNMAASSDNLGKTLEESTTESVRQLAANMEYLGSLVSDFISGNWGTDANGNTMAQRAANAKAASLESTKVADTPKTTVDLGEQQANLVAQLQMMGITATIDENGNVKYDGEVDWEKIMGGYSSEDASGGNGTVDGVNESKWDQLISKYENQLALITNERDLIEAEIDRMEATGGKASKELYNDLIRSQLEEKQLLEEKKQALQDYLDTYGDTIDPDTWTEYNNEINATAVAIKECTTNIYDFAQSLKEIDMHYFNESLDDISRLGEEIEFIMGLFEDEDMSDEFGNWTDAGITKINLLRDLMTTYAAQAERWQGRLNELGGMTKGENGLYAFDEKTKNSIAEDFKSMLDAGKISQEAYDEYMVQLNDAFAQGGFSEELWQQWNEEAEDGLRDAINGQKDAQDQMLDMWDDYLDKIEEGIEKEIDAYNDLIDVQKKELEAARDLHDFKKQIANDTKDIQELERRIASLSGSTAAADIAERRRLQAQLRDKQSELDDRFYDHAQDAQQNALDDEAEAFEKAKQKYIEIMRETADDTEWVINQMIQNGIFNADVANAFLKRIQETYNVPLSTELTTPWDAAAETAKGLKTSVGVPVDETVTMISNSIVQKLGTNDENNPWNKAVAMADKYADFLTTEEFSLDNEDLTTFEGQISKIVSGWQDVKEAADEAAKSANIAKETTVGGNPNAGNGDDEVDYAPIDYTPDPAMHADGKNSIRVAVGSESKLSDKSKKTVDGQQYYMHTDGYYYPAAQYKFLYFDYDERGKKKAVYGFPAGTTRYKYYAKGTTGTSRDELAIVDELGPELILHANEKTGRLEYLTAGSSVIPHDATTELLKLADLGVSGLTMPKFDSGVNMMTNYITKPELKVDIEEFVHVDRVDQDTLPKLEAMMDKKINDFSKALNYSIKRFAR